jgi:hypothetical protein
MACLPWFHRWAERVATLLIVGASPAAVLLGTIRRPLLFACSQRAYPVSPQPPREGRDMRGEPRRLNCGPQCSESRTTS